MTWIGPFGAASSLLARLQETASPAALAAGGAAVQAAVERKLHFLVAAYTVVWVILALYLLTLSFRLRRLSLMVRRMKERLGL